MGIVKAQYGVANSKASYTAGTSKQQVSDNYEASGAKCTRCTSFQPIYIDVTIDNNIIDCSGCNADDAPPNFYTKVTSAIASTFRNATYRLTHLGAGVPPLCTWQYVDTAGSFGQAKRYSDSGCTVLTNTYDFTTLRVGLQFTTATTYVLFINVTEAGNLNTHRCFYATGTIISGDCFDVDGQSKSNTTICSTLSTGYVAVCDNGIATIAI